MAFILCPPAARPVPIFYKMHHYFLRINLHLIQLFDGFKTMRFFNIKSKIKPIIIIEWAQIDPMEAVEKQTGREKNMQKNIHIHTRSDRKLPT